MPKWVKTAIYAVGALVGALIGVNIWFGFVGGHASDVLGACASIGAGLIACLIGIFGKEFHWGEGASGPPAPRWAGATLFILVSLAFIVGGIIALLRA
jgi:hypothetical protein